MRPSKALRPPYLQKDAKLNLPSSCTSVTFRPDGNAQVELYQTLATRFTPMFSTLSKPLCSEFDGSESDIRAKDRARDQPRADAAHLNCPESRYEVHIVSPGGGSCRSRRLRRRSRKLDEYHGQPSIGHHYKQPSGPSWIHRDWKFRKRKESGTVASRRSFVEDFADKHGNCRGYYRLDGRSYLLRTRQRHRYRECSPEPTIHCEQWSAEHVSHDKRDRDTDLSVTITG